MVLLGITHPIPKDSGKDHSNSGIENSSATCAAAMRKSQLLGPNNKSIEPWVAGQCHAKVNPLAKPNRGIRGFFPTFFGGVFFLEGRGILYIYIYIHVTYIYIYTSKGVRGSFNLKWKYTPQNQQKIAPEN